jgi:hypothetical protein
MRWTVKQKQTKPTRPVVGDIRTRIRFAIFPKRINDTVIWLERYWVREELKQYQHYYLSMERFLPVVEWVEIECAFI